MSNRARPRPPMHVLRFHPPARRPVEPRECSPRDACGQRALRTGSGALQELARSVGDARRLRPDGPGQALATEQVLSALQLSGSKRRCSTAVATSRSSGCREAPKPGGSESGIPRGHTRSHAFWKLIAPLPPQADTNAGLDRSSLATRECSSARLRRLSSAPAWPCAARRARRLLFRDVFADPPSPGR